MAVRSLNKVMIIGNLTRDPELRYTANGTPVVTFGVATNREYSPSNSNEVIETTEFHNIVVWSKLAELCDKLLKKGDKVYIEGRLQTRDWEDEKSGKKMYRTETVANEMILLSSKRGSSEETGKFTPTEESASTESVEKKEEDSDSSDNEKVSEEIPF